MVTGNLRAVAVAGAFFSGFGQFFRVMIQILSIVILARILTPSDFGVTAMVFPIIAFATVLQEAGLGAAVMQRETVSQEELSTLFYVNVLVGGGLAALLVVLSPLVAAFYGEPRVGPLTAASGMLVLLGSLSGQPLSLLNRNMRFRSLAIIDIMSLAVGFLLAVGTALLFHTYWAIWLLSFGSTVTTFVLAWALGGFRPGRSAPSRQIFDMLRFGGNMTLYSFFTYFARNLDNVLIGKVWGDAALGLYDRAYKLMLLPLVFVNAPLQRLVLPILTKTRDEAPRYRSVYATALQTALAITMPLVIMLIVNADRVIALVLGPSWGDAALVFHWLSLASLMQLVTTTAGWLYISQGRAYHMMVAGAGSSLVACIAFFIGLPWGPTGVACAYAVGEVLKAPLLIWWVTREGPFKTRDAAACLWPFVIAGLCCYASVSILSHWLPGNAVLTIAALTAASYASLLGGLLVTGSGRACLLRVGQLADSGTGLVMRRLRPSQAV